MQTSERFYRYSSLTLSSFLLLWYFFGIDLSSIPLIKDIPKIIGEKVIEILTVCLMIFFNFETFLEWSKNKNTNTKEDHIRFLTAILYSLVCLIIIYNKLVSNTLLDETDRTDLLISILFGFILSFCAFVLRELIDMGITFYQLRKIILPHLLWGYLASIAIIILIIYVFQLITSDINFISFIFMYFLLAIIFIFTFCSLCYIQPSVNKSKALTKLISRHLDYVERSSEIAVLSENEKLQLIGKGKRKHKKTMKYIRSGDKQQIDKLKCEIEVLGDLKISTIDDKLTVNDIDPEKNIFLKRILSSQSSELISEIKLKFKYVKSALDRINREQISFSGFNDEQLLDLIYQYAFDAYILSEGDPNEILMKVVHFCTFEQLRHVVRNMNVDINCRNQDGYTPLLLATANGEFDKAQFLLQKAADPNIPNKLGITPLIFAAMYGKYQLCELLVSFGALINYQATDGGTPLIMASLSGHGNIVKFLLDKGADPNLRDCSEQTALDNAIQGNHGEIAKMLRKR